MGTKTPWSVGNGISLRPLGNSHTLWAASSLLVPSVFLLPPILKAISKSSTPQISSAFEYSPLPCHVGVWEANSLMIEALSQCVCHQSSDVVQYLQSPWNNMHGLSRWRRVNRMREAYFQENSQSYNCVGHWDDCSLPTVVPWTGAWRHIFRQITPGQTSPEHSQGPWTWNWNLFISDCSSYS